MDRQAVSIAPLGYLYDYGYGTGEPALIARILGHVQQRLESDNKLARAPPIATKRLSVDGRGRVIYQYKHPFRDGSTHVVLEPLNCSDF